MRKVNVKEVKTKREMDDFVRLTERLYAGCPYYVPDMDTDIRDTFDPVKMLGWTFRKSSLSLHTMKTGMWWGA